MNNIENKTTKNKNDSNKRNVPILNSSSNNSSGASPETKKLVEEYSDSHDDESMTRRTKMR